MSHCLFVVVRIVLQIKLYIIFLACVVASHIIQKQL